MSRNTAAYLLAFALLLFSACSRRPGDDTIATQIKAKYFSDPDIKAAPVSVTVKDGQVTLSGSVPNPDIHLRMFKVAYNTAGVRAIVDELSVVPPEPAAPPAVPAQILADAAAAAGAKPVTAAPVPDPPVTAAPVPEPPPPVQIQVVTPPPVQVRVNSPAARFAPAVHPVPPPPREDAPVVVESTVVVPVVRVGAGAGSSEVIRKKRRSTINGAGPRSGQAVFESWFANFQEASPEFVVDYNSTSAPAGLQLFTQHAIDFLLASAALTDAQSAAANRPFHFPIFLDAIVPAYNLPGVRGPVYFTPEALAGIYAGTIRRWNEPAIANANPRLILPSSDIAFIRSAGSNSVLTDYLSRVSPLWSGSDSADNQGKRRDGLTASSDTEALRLLHQNPDSIAFLDFSFAVENQVSRGAVRNSAGIFVHAPPESIQAAALAAFRTSNDGRVSLVNSPNRAAYPISRYTWCIVPSGWSEKRSVAAALVQWILSTGQSSVNPFVALPKPVAENAIEAARRLR